LEKVSKGDKKTTNNFSQSFESLCFCGSAGEKLKILSFKLLPIFSSLKEDAYPGGSELKVGAG